MTLVRFGTVGVANTLITLITFTLLTAAGVTAPVASALAFAAGAANGYVLNRSWTFRVRGSAGTFARYVCVQGLGAACSAGGIVLVAAALQARRPVAECLVIPVVTLITFTLSRTVVFRAAGPGRERRALRAPTQLPAADSGPSCG